jgi:hypothetical protein
MVERAVEAKATILQKGLINKKINFTKHHRLPQRHKDTK